MTPVQPFFVVGRNEPCPCGSERKYKRCCLNGVEAALRALAAKAERFPNAPGGGRLGAGLQDMLRGMALACALPRDEDLGERPLSVEKAARLLDEVVAALEAEDEARLEGFQQDLVRLLQEDDELRELRFWPDDVEAAAERAGPEKSPEAVLRPLVTPDQADDAAWGMVAALRRPGRTDDQLRALTWGLLNAALTFHFPLEDNALWRAVLHLTLKEVGEFEELVERTIPPEGNLAGTPPDAAAGAASEATPTAAPGAVGGMPEAQPATLSEAALNAPGKAPDAAPEAGAADPLRAAYEYVEEHPIVDRHLSRIYSERVRPAVSALESGAIPLDIPPYALANSFLSLRGAVFRVLSDVLSYKSLDRVKLSPEEVRQVNAAAWEHDYPLLVPAVTGALESWLDRHGAGAKPELAAAVRRLADTFGSDFLRGERHMFTTIVWLAMSRLWKANPVLAPAAGEQGLPGDGPLTLVGFLTAPDGPERYAAALEASGLPDAAAHVRAAAQRTAAPPPLRSPAQ